MDAMVAGKEHRAEDILTDIAEKERVSGKIGMICSALRGTAILMQGKSTNERIEKARPAKEQFQMACYYATNNVGMLGLAFNGRGVCSSYLAQEKFRNGQAAEAMPLLKDAISDASRQCEADRTVAALQRKLNNENYFRLLAVSFYIHSQFDSSLKQHVDSIANTEDTEQALSRIEGFLQTAVGMTPTPGAMLSLAGLYCVKAEYYDQRQSSQLANDCLEKSIQTIRRLKQADKFQGMSAAELLAYLEEDATFWPLFKHKAWQTELAHRWSAKPSDN